MKLIKRNLVLISILFVCMIAPAIIIHASESDVTVIRVGYTGNSGMLNIPVISGSEGYGYEYLYQLLEYTDEQYEIEFVLCEWSEGFELLESGEIDLFGPTNYTEEKDALFYYMDEDIGESTYMLIALDESDAFGSDYSMLDGEKVGVPTGYSNIETLEIFLEDNDIEVEIVEIDNTDFEADMVEQGCKYYFTSSMKFDESYEVVLCLGVQPVYFIGGSHSADIIEDLDNAMTELKRNEYLYEEYLMLKYFDYDLSASAYITKEEYALLQEQDVYYVGVMNLYGALSNENSEGELEGVAIDVVEMIADAAGINVEYVELTMESTPSDYANLDFYFLNLDDSIDLETKDSDVYYEIPLLLVERSYEEESEYVGIVGYYGYDEESLDEYLDGRELIYYFDIHDLKEAYNQQEIDTMIITTASLNMIREDITDKAFYSDPMDLTVNLSLTFPEDYSDEKINVFNKIIYGLDSNQIEYSLLVHSSSEATEYTIIDMIRNNPFILAGIALVILGVLYILNYRKRMELDKVINIDSVTGFYTQHKFVYEAKKILENNTNKSYTILTMDIDNFKYVNEIYGYELGTAVLIRLAEHLREASANALLIARSFGDNFIFLFETAVLEANIDLGLSRANPSITKLNREIGADYTFSFSVGSYVIKDSKEDVNYMIDCANMARNLGKSTVGTTYYKFTEIMNKERITNNEIAASMMNAIEEKEFILYYQPKVDLRTKEIVGAEALVRWVSNDKIVPPNHFVPIFEKNGFISRLDIYVFEEVCRFIHDNRNMCIPKIAINLSGITIQKEDLVEKLLDLTRRYIVSPSEIDIEITETAFVKRFDIFTVRVRDLRMAGFTISMDDFGAGISSLNRLKSMEIDAIKIDREFIVNSLEDEKGTRIIKNIIRMAKDINVEIVAEGIEMSAQSQFLLENGCDVGQGYFFSKPLPEEQFVKMIIDKL